MQLVTKQDFSKLFLMFTHCFAKASKVSPSILTAADIRMIAPETQECLESSIYLECANATRAADFMNLSYDIFSITDFGTQAALLSLTLHETDNFKYNRHEIYTAPGRGIQTKLFLTSRIGYGKWLLENIGDPYIAEAIVNANLPGIGDLEDLLRFGSAAWFLTTQCDLSIATGLAAQNQQGWQKYVADCVGITITADLTAFWQRAIELGDWSG